MRLIIGDMFQGRKDYAFDRYGRDISLYLGLADSIHNLMDRGCSEPELIDRIIEKMMAYDVVIAEEAYGGLTLIDEAQRNFAEIYGRCLIELAKKAESVERVVCGLGIALK